MRLLTTLLLSTLFICGCGGGGSSSTPTTNNGNNVNTTLTFPLKKGITANVVSGISFTMTANGTAATATTNGNCSGSGTFNRGQPTSSTFMNQSALNTNFLLTMSFTNCNPSIFSQTNQYYYDTNYNLLGQKDTATGETSVFESTPNIPANVRVGDVINVGIMNDFSDSTLKYKTGYSQMTMVIEQDTPNTAIVNKLVKAYDARGALKTTGSERSRIDLNGNLSVMSMDIQSANYPYFHLVLRR